MAAAQPFTPPKRVDGNGAGDGGGATVKVIVGGVTTEYPLGVLAQEALHDKLAVAARMDNEVVPLQERILGSTVRLEAVPLNSADGIRVLVETLKFLLKIAKQECTPEFAIIIGRPIGAAYYCTLSDRTTGEPHEPTEDELQAMERAMTQKVEEGMPIQYKIVSIQEAMDNMAKTGVGFTAQVLTDCNKSQLQVVEGGGMYHLPRSPIVPNAGMLPKESFKLCKFKEGFLLEHYRCDSGSGDAKHWARDRVLDELLYNEYMDRQRWARDVGLYSVQQLNTAIRENRSKSVIQAVEANCDRQFVEIASKIKARKDTKLVLIAGPSSSGKTTFSKRLQVQLEALGFKPVVLSVDNFYKAWQDITPEGPQKVDWEALESLNLEQLNEALLTLMRGEEATIPEYDMKTSMPCDQAHWSKMKLSGTGKGIIIMEGIHCLNPALTSAVPKADKFHVAIAPIPALQLDAVHTLSGTTIRMLRRMVRDYLNRGRPVLATLRQWPAIAAGEVNNIYPHQGNADVVMNSDIGYEMCVLKVHAEPLLRTVRPTEPEYSEVRRLLSTLDQFIALPTNIIPPQSLIREFIGGSWYYDYGGWYKSY